MPPVFAAQSQLDIPAWRHNHYPVYETYEFTFYRCLAFNNKYYGRTISDLHAGNLRESDGRYSSLFPGHRISYWSGDRQTAKKEVASHRDCRNYVMFEAYDDASSFIPSLPNRTSLVIADGRFSNFEAILEKWEQKEVLTSEERSTLLHILDLDLDCLAYKSHANPSGENYIFFEKGFRKLALRRVLLLLGARKSRNTATVHCATTCDYWPDLESYGKRFEHIARITMDETYLDSNEYRLRNTVVNESCKKLRGPYDEY